ncbi:MAG: F-box protein: endocytic membrane traffic, recycling ReCYcling 1 [Sclerophora amabilis]|nr:MAG: F-box protein: endocytic membrane traffic, recycling ReCYcling 1 [Sclerophora amabilis]
MSNFKRAPVKGGRPRQDVLAPLRATQMVTQKPVLPAEIIAMILDYLPTPDLFQFALVSRRMQEMVYDDTRWVQRLRLMDCWNEAEARTRIEQDMRRKQGFWNDKQGDESRKSKDGPVATANGLGPSHGRPNTTLFDSGVEENKQRLSAEGASKRHQGSHHDGFKALSLSSEGSTSKVLAASAPESQLDVFSKVKSARGFARQEFGRIYRALAPLYMDIARSETRSAPVIFRIYQTPEHQAKMLAQLGRFAKCDLQQGWKHREEKLNEITDAFEDAALKEFEQGCKADDVEGVMQRYAHVLMILNGGQKAVETFIRDNAIFTNRYLLGNPMECLSQATSDNIYLQPSNDFFQRVSSAINKQSEVIDVVFPTSDSVLLTFLDRVGENIVSEYITPLFDEAHSRSIESYLKAVSGIYEQSLRFARTIRPTLNSGDSFQDDLNRIVTTIFEPHVDLYMREEMDFFKKRSDNQVSIWEKKLSEQDASTESYFMSNVNRQADKRDFLSSFKKVVMMPVNVLPSMSFTASKPAATSGVSSNGNANNSSRPGTPRLLSGQPPVLSRAVSPAPEAPTTELAAKAAIMNSRLEGIRSLFNIEVALNLVHAAKGSLERVALFVNLGSDTGQLAKEQCEIIFVLLLNILGSRHIKSGFDTAVDHLSKYDPKAVSEHNQPGVAPLVMFLELVSVGDLIQQMVDVFYEQELIATKLTDRNDFLDPAVKEKKKFEQMLDERVAAGLNKGIEVLMDEVEYLCATSQSSSDYNPGAAGNLQMQSLDVGPTQTAKHIVNIVSTHTKMLVGSTDKNMLDVFNQEVGVRLFTALCKHLKRQRISVEGSIKLISDMNHYFEYIQTLRNAELLQYFKALREVSQIYLIDPAHSKEMATIIADGDRFYGIFRAEEVYEFAERRADWFQVKKGVERQMYGIGCSVM